MLDYCYGIFHEDDVGGMLGALSLFSDGTPVDLAMYDDWYQISLSSKSFREKILSFLEMYETNYGMDFEKTKAFLLKMTNQEIENIIKL